MVGMMAACPDGKGFKATFSDFKIKLNLKKAMAA